METALNYAITAVVVYFVGLGMAVAGYMSPSEFCGSVLLIAFHLDVCALAHWIRAENP